MDPEGLPDVTSRRIFVEMKEAANPGFERQFDCVSG